MMRYLLRGLVGTAILSLSLTALKAQEYHVLTIDDFQGTPAPGYAGNIAYTHCYVDFKYTPHRHNNYYLLDFDIHVTMANDKSWVDRSRITSRQMLAEILKHEQGHYNIAYLEAQELMRTLRKTVFYADYQTVTRNIFDRIDAHYQQINKSYDDDTNHSINRIQQHSWDVYFQKCLANEYAAAGR